nr:hypothetical protein [Kribbella sandramycini]
MSSRSVRRTALTAAAATLSIVLGACGANFNAQTAQPYQPAEGTNADSAGIAVRNLLVVASADGKGELHGVLVNNGAAADTLVSITQAPPKPVAPVAEGEQPPAPVVVTFGKFEPLPLALGDSITLPQTGGIEPTPTATPTSTPTATPTATPTTTPSPAAPKPFSVTGGKPGTMIDVVITFGKAAPITTHIPVITEDHFSPTPRDDAEKGEGGH